MIAPDPAGCLVTVKIGSLSSSAPVGATTRSWAPNADGCAVSRMAGRSRNSGSPTRGAEMSTSAAW